MTALLGFLGGVAASGLTAATTVRINRSRIHADTRARWDSALLEKCNEMSAATRSLRHVAERYQRSTDKNAQRAKLDDHLQQIRVLTEQLRLLGNGSVQIAARRVHHHAYSVRVMGEEGRDPRAESYPGTSPIRRLNDALQEFYCAVRLQLGLAQPDDVIHDDDLDLISGTSNVQPLDWSNRSSAG